MPDPTACSTPTLYTYVASAGFGSIATLFVTTFIGNRSDRERIKQDKYKNCLDALSKHEDRYGEYTSNLGEFCQNKAATLSVFQKISVSGDKFFSNLNLMAAAVMSGSLEERFSRDTIIPKILDNYRNIESHYTVLNEIAIALGQNFPVEFTRANYSAIFDVVDTYG